MTGESYIGIADMGQWDGGRGCTDIFLLSTYLFDIKKKKWSCCLPQKKCE